MNEAMAQDQMITIKIDKTWVLSMFTHMTETLKVFANLEKFEGCWESTKDQTPNQLRCPRTTTAWWSSTV